MAQKSYITKNVKTEQDKVQNLIVQDITTLNSDVRTVETDIGIVQNDITTIQGDIIALEASALGTYLEVVIDYTEVRQLSSLNSASGKLILPALGAGKYPKILDMIVEYVEDNGTPPVNYTFGGTEIYFHIDWVRVGQFQPSMIQLAGDKAAPIPFGATEVTAAPNTESAWFTPDTPMYLWADANPTLGLGTVIVKIWYQEVTIGETPS